MVKKHLGNSIDIHGGGLDLVFPHHENEIAQSESSTGHKPFAQIWVHNGLLKRSGDEKMSKSLGNSLDVRDALNNYSGNSIRLWILQSHYRHPSSLDENSLDIAQKSIQRIQRTLILRGEDGFDNKDYKNKFLIAMKDDLGTPKAIATIFDLIHDINKSNDLDKKINEGVILLEIDQLKEEENKLFQEGKKIESEEVVEKRYQQEENLKLQREQWGFSEKQIEIVEPKHIAKVISEKTGIPIDNLIQSEAKKLLKLEEKLHKRVIEFSNSIPDPM